MKVLGISGEMVEVLFSNDNEVVHMQIEDFIEKYGKEMLYGDKIQIEENDVGTLYIC